MEKRKNQSRTLVAQRRAKLREMGFVRIEVTCHSADVDKVREFVSSLVKQPPAQMDHTDARESADQH